MKFLYPALILTFLTIYHTAQGSGSDWRKLSGFETTEHVVGLRQIRSGPALINFARTLRGILMKSTFSYVHSGFRVFIRPGGYYQAMDDFMLLNPNGSLGNTVNSGFVDGRRLILDLQEKEIYLVISRFKKYDKPEIVIKYIQHD